MHESTVGEKLFSDSAFRKETFSSHGDFVLRGTLRAYAVLCGVIGEVQVGIALVF